MSLSRSAVYLISTFIYLHIISAADIHIARVKNFSEWSIYIYFRAESGPIALHDCFSIVSRNETRVFKMHRTIILYPPHHTLRAPSRKCRYSIVRTNSGMRRTVYNICHTRQVNIRRYCNLNLSFQLLLFTRTHGDLLFRHAQQQKRYNPAIPSLPWYLAPSQEFVLREIILESIIPSLSDTNAIHKRLLDASFYGNSVAATYSSDDVNVLSRGNVYRLPNGHWMLCEDGCVDCEPCVTQGNSLFKWILQKVKRSSVFDLSQHDFQLTIISQTDDYFRTNLWPNFYIYVTSQGEGGSISVTRTQHNNDSENSPPNLENSSSQQHHSKDLFTERDSISEEENPIQESTDKSPEQMHQHMRHRFLPIEKPAEEANQLAPKLILGIDQQGQKHLIHVVPADHPPINASHLVNLFVPNHSTSSNFVEGQATPLNNIIPKQEKQTYQQIFRRVFDSLNTHRESIESFLESPTDNVSEQQIASSTDNIEVAEFSWNNRDVNHTSANFEPLRSNDTLLSPFYVEDEAETEKYRQRKSRYGYQRIKPNGNDYYTRYANLNQAGILRGQLPMNFDFDRERRRARVRPYFINNKNISEMNSSILLQSSSDSSSVDAIPKPGFKNGFVANSAKQIDLNETFVDKANNNSIESSSITIKRENGRLFNSERLASGDANREFETSHHAFRIITTESPVIRRGHETLNRTAALQINASKTFADNQ